MTTLTKTLLAATVISITIGFATDWLWGFGKPAGAILFGLFLVSKMLEKEVAQFDVEEEARRARASEVNGSPVPSHSEHHDEPLRAAA